MLAQVVLTPTESKKLISKAIAGMAEVRKAAAEGTLLLHPSSSTYFIVEELTGEKPRTNYWVCGVVTPKGMCVEMGMMEYTPKTIPSDPREFRGWWAIKNGKLSAQETLAELLEAMKPTDFFIKGVNAIDTTGKAGVLIGALQGGTLGIALSAWKRKNFGLIFPAGLEKLIPTPIDQASREARQTKYEYGMGLPAGLFPCPPGKVVTEIDAVRMLSGAEAIPIAAGGLGGAEGAITLVIKGEEEPVKKAIAMVEQSKGAKLPALRLSNCFQCPVPDCRFPVGDKPWVEA